MYRSLLSIIANILLAVHRVAFDFAHYFDWNCVFCSKGILMTSTPLYDKLSARQVFDKLSTWPLSNKLSTQLVSVDELLVQPVSGSEVSAQPVSVSEL